MPTGILSVTTKGGPLWNPLLRSRGLKHATVEQSVNFETCYITHFRNGSEKVQLIMRCFDRRQPKTIA